MYSVCVCAKERERYQLRVCFFAVKTVAVGGSSIFVRFLSEFSKALRCVLLYIQQCVNGNI